MSKNISSTIDQPVQWASLMERVHEQLREHLAQKLDYYFSKLQAICGSPIEVILGAAFILSDRDLKVPYDSSLLLVDQKQSITIIPGVDRYRLLVPQYKWRSYVIDFAYIEPHQLIFIECDGHDFHERTKEQAARDRSKDREVQSSGITILRFTGSQIYADPCGCVDEIYEHIIFGWGRS